MALYNYILLAVSVILIVFTVRSVMRRKNKKARFERAVHGIAITVGVFLISAVVLFPNLNSIPVTGDNPYASCVLELTDTSRMEEYGNDGGPRKLSVLVYYPTNNAVPRSSCPLVVFSHGGISTKTSNLSLYKELASHGYVVVGIDHTYHALRTKIDGKKIPIDPGYMKELTGEDSYRDIENSFACFQKWMKLRTDDISFVIDCFIEKASSDSPSFYSLIDKNRIGVAGHSLGGSAALGVARQREDITAVMALESPFMCDITGVDTDRFTWNTDPYPCAVLNIYSDSGYSLIGSDNKYVQNKNYLYNGENVRFTYIQGSNHYTLTDLVRTSPILCALLGGRYEKNGYETLEIINRKSLAFFDEYLK
jgi:dienelactone hydrolase